MNKIILALLPLLFISEMAYCQAPEQDCINALPICQNVYSTNNSYTGEGNILNEINGATSCLTAGELNDVWYTFTVQTSGNCSFLITPNIATNDYDWAVFNLTNANCTDIFTNPALEVSCNYSATFGATGPNGGSGLSSQGPGGTPFNAVIPVLAGETYVINISNNSSVGQGGYTIDFSNSTAQIFDNIPPHMVSLNTPISCGANQVTLTFSENILCSTVQATDFTLTGPGGYTITSAISAICAAGGNHGKVFTITFNPAIHAGGTYHLNLVDTVTDLCGNVGTLGFLPFTVISTVTAIPAHTDVSCYGNTDGSATVTPGGGTAPYTFLWSNGATTQSLSNIAAGTYTVTVTESSGCASITSTTVNQPVPLTGTTSAVSACVGTPTTITCTFTGVGPFSYHYSGDAGLNITTASNTVTFTYPSGGSYHYTVTATDPNGCMAVDSAIAVVAAKPVASFYYTVNSDRYTVSLINTSTGNPTDVLWHLGIPYVSSQSYNASYTYPDTGTYRVWLYITTALGCRDSVAEWITLTYNYAFWVPNSFTPNHNTINDYFNAVAINISGYQMLIFDRWGEQLFSTNDIAIGWDGKDSKGSDVPQGIYIYSIQFLDQDGNLQQYHGKVSLLR